MCTVSVKVDEDMLRGVLPELENNAAIRKWAQMLIDARIRELVEETKVSSAERDMTPEDVYGLEPDDLSVVYAAEDTETVSLEEARALLHKTIREEYARP